MKGAPQAVLSDSLLPAVIIREHIQKILQADNINTYISDIEKLEDLMSTETDEKYEEALKKIRELVDDLNVSHPNNMNKASYAEFANYERAKKHQYEKRLIFRALVNLAKRKGIWLVDEEEAILSHDKKKAISTDGKSSAE